MNPQQSVLAAVVLGSLVSSCANKQTTSPTAHAPIQVAVVPLGVPGVSECPHPGDEALLGRVGADDVGRSPQKPLQWGRAANGELWFGRLVCPGGAAPRITRIGAIPSDEITVSTWQIVDEWSVICPEFSGEERWFSTAESCDMTDPPSGLGVMSVAVADALGEVAALRKAGDPTGALALSREVVDAFPDLQAPQLALLVSAITVKDGPTARRALQDALAFNSDDLRLVVMEALFYVRGGDMKGAARVLERPDVTTEADAQVLACAKGRLAFLEGKKAAAVALRKEACGGDENCCPDALARLVGR